jgi:membrane protein DedA with SNARE-associated domain/rhodanese-related sulfurtransferase
MELPEHILIAYGYFLLFGWVLIEQLGIPLPSMPALLAAGALSAEHQISFPLALADVVVATMIADSIWYVIGKRYGHRVLQILCKLSLEPTTCVRRTQDSFGKRHAVTLLIAKFIPGLTTLAPPMAGQNGIGFLEFLFYDTLGSLAYFSSILALGRFFGDALKRDPTLLNWAGRFSGALIIGGVAAFLFYRICRRRIVLRKLAASRLEPEELKRQLDSGEEVFIVDLRHPLELLPDPFKLPGALHFSPDELTARQSEIPRDRDVVLYCTCPSEATAAKTALTLHSLGIERVRPLRGGFFEWKRLGYPMDAIPPINPMVTVAQIAK